MKELILLKIEELEDEYNSIDLSNDELKLSQVQRKYDERLNILNAKKNRREAIMKELEKHRNAQAILNELAPVEETEVDPEEEGEHEPID